MCWEQWVGLGRSPFGKLSLSRAAAGTGRGVCFSSGLRHSNTWTGEREQNTRFGVAFIFVSRQCLCTPQECVGLI